MTETQAPAPKAAKVRNILFIMADQLRWEYLGCAGHKTIRTPTIDALAARGVRFTNAYAQAAVCGPSRMSFYTGLSVANHGSTWNGVPLPIGTPTMGSYLRAMGLRVAVAGKTHMTADRDGAARLGLDGVIGVQEREAGFEPYCRDDGLHPSKLVSADLAYNRYLNAHGYDGANPWHDYANSATGPNGEILSGWSMRHANLPARVDRRHAETPWMTDQAIRFIEEQGDNPWCLHLSYIKPHWPYMAPSPYHDLYGPADLSPPARSEAERKKPHPVYEAFMRHEEGRNFSKQVVRDRVVPTYMGLITQIDDELERLFAALVVAGRMADTLVVFTSDHGDYLGDHWLGEKELFHDPSVKIPLIIAGPGVAEGVVEDRLVGATDLLPSFIEALGGAAPMHALDGLSLTPLLGGPEPETQWRDSIVSELDYGWRQARRDLGLKPDEARGWMLRTERWKYIAYLGFRPQLFDLENDPDELEDLGEDGRHAGIRDEMRSRMFDWFARRKNRRTLSDDAVEARTATWKSRGIIFGEW